MPLTYCLNIHPGETWAENFATLRTTVLAVRELVSPGNAKHDTVKKLRLYHQVGVPHYWLVDPRDSTLTVMRWSEDGYVTLMRAERGELVRAEPFHAIELAVGTLFGDDPPEVT